MFNNFKLGTRLYAGFFLIVFLLGGVSIYQIYGIVHLGKLQGRIAVEAEESRVIKDVANRVALVYPVIADAIINRDFDKTKSNFLKIKAVSEKDIRVVGSMTTTEAGKSLAREFTANYQAYLDFFENKLLGHLVEASEHAEHLGHDSDKGMPAEYKPGLAAPMMMGSNSGMDMPAGHDQAAAGPMNGRQMETKAVQASGMDEYGEHKKDVTDHMDMVRELHDQLEQMRVATVIPLNKLIQSFVKKSDNAMGHFEIVRQRTIRLTAVALFLGVAFAVFLAHIITRAVVRPLNKTMTMIHEMENGHLDMRLGITGGSEIGKMAGSMDRFADSLQNEIVGALEKLATQDLTFSAIPKDDQDVLRRSLQKAGSDLSNIIAEIRSAGDQVTQAAAQIADTSQVLSQGATEQASSLEEISSSMAEMSSQIKTNAENASQANSLASEARETAARGSNRMQDMVQAMDEISQAGMNISKIIKVIDEIAFQTNLLALNAAVEAARAGRHGKGFAVVAEEVRNLAARSAKAASETSDLIEGTVAKTENGAEIAGQTAAALEEIVASNTKVSDLIGEIAAASNEQAQGIAQVSEGLNQVDSVTQQNTASAEESAAAAEELSAQASYLSDLLGRFTLQGGERRQLGEARGVGISGSESDLRAEQG